MCVQSLPTVRHWVSIFRTHTVTLYEPPHLHKLCLASCRRNAKIPRFKNTVPGAISHIQADWRDVARHLKRVQPVTATTFISRHRIWRLATWNSVRCSENKQPTRSCLSAHLMFPHIHTVWKLFLTIAVSTASANRLFSGLWQLKTCLKSNMTDECLSDLTLLHIDHATEVDIPSVIQEFDATGSRRFALLHTPDPAWFITATNKYSTSMFC